MNPIVNLSFVAPDLNSFLSALDALKAAGVAPVSSVSQSAPATLPGPQKLAERTLGPNESAYLSAKGLQRMRVTEDDIKRWGDDRELVAAGKLSELGTQATSGEQEGVVAQLPTDDGESFF